MVIILIQETGAFVKNVLKKDSFKLIDVQAEFAHDKGLIFYHLRGICPTCKKEIDFRTDWETIEIPL